MEKENDFPLHFKAYLNSLEYESQYVYFFLAKISLKITPYIDIVKNQNTSINFPSLTICVVSNFRVCLNNHSLVCFSNTDNSYQNANTTIGELIMCFNCYEFTEVNLQHGINEIAIDGQT